MPAPTCEKIVRLGKNRFEHSARRLLRFFTMLGSRASASATFVSGPRENFLRVSPVAFGWFPQSPLAPPDASSVGMIGHKPPLKHRQVGDGPQTGPPPNCPVAARQQLTPVFELWQVMSARSFQLFSNATSVHCYNDLATFQRPGVSLKPLDSLYTQIGKEARSGTDFPHRRVLGDTAHRSLTT